MLILCTKYENIIFLDIFFLAEWLFQYELPRQTIFIVSIIPYNVVFYWWLFIFVCINSKTSIDGKAQEANNLMKYTSSQITGITLTVEVRLKVITTMSLWQKYEDRCLSLTPFSWWMWMVSFMLKLSDHQMMVPRY